MVQPAGNVGCGDWLVARDFDQIVQTPVACLAQDCLGTVVEIAAIELVAALLENRPPASQ